MQKTCIKFIQKMLTSTKESNICIFKSLQPPDYAQIPRIAMITHKGQKLLLLQQQLFVTTCKILLITNQHIYLNTTNSIIVLYIGSLQKQLQQFPIQNYSTEQQICPHIFISISISISNIWNRLREDKIVASLQSMDTEMTIFHTLGIANSIINNVDIFYQLNSIQSIENDSKEIINFDLWQSLELQSLQMHTINRILGM
eukprot:TRINITY_DN275_c0_g1_i11.p2 TRINITY_DN275_c0_g1~~TRINITY_DN275_c0_g1_i11.p2  ORF type:complete len:200 (-),score=-5.53 TRINITY_DN275_c0_g1_i11:1332-1931(-)